MEKKNRFGELISSAGKTAKNLFDNAVQAVDQNDDGKFNFSDIAEIAENVGDAMKKGTQVVKDGAEEKARQLELKALQPIFSDSLDSADFFMPKFIRVTERDKRHAESEVCQGSIGYSSDQKGLHFINLFRDSLEAFGLAFYPDNESEFYYVDPSDRDRYIALDEYFSYLKIARVNELQKIAQDLGAKHFKVTYMEEKTAFSEKKGKIGINLKGVGNSEGKREITEKKYDKIEIAAEMECPGHEPMKPQLKYMQRDPSIQTLVAMRMDESAPLMRQKFMLKMSNSSGIKEADAVKIDAVLKGLKYSGNTTVESEAKNEARRYLEYEIEF
ncbi:MAG: hypothetical protein IJF53_03335 [Clostridia bacterium]|nr:hypothetical protein [Clostridia bacterium]